METNFTTIKAENENACILASVNEWASWYEGEEGWGPSGDNDDDD